MKFSNKSHVLTNQTVIENYPRDGVVDLQLLRANVVKIVCINSSLKYKIC